MILRRHTLLCLLGLGVAVALGLTVYLKWRSPQRTPEPAENSFPLPPYSTSPYLNTGPEARYIGTAACAGCHRPEHQSYLLTAHSRALGEPDLADEPPDGSFFNKASGRSYRVYRQDGVLRHEEVLRTAEGQEIARVDVPVRYRIGSLSRSYLVEIDGFLHESPITWYASQGRWDMSPGYNVPHNLSFERAVPPQCLFCHSGRTQLAPGTVHRTTVLEKAIGCENCHGPGSLHEELHRSGKFVRGQLDRTIVRPNRLSRELQDAICANCHLSNGLMSFLRGREATDFRPGMPLTDYRIDYQIDNGDDEMTVVGHVEQLRRSACYQKSGTLTCLTCHDPHQGKKPADPVAFQRQKCLGCHTEAACRLDTAERHRKDPTDNCMSCHMPRSKTDVPHVAFTHHRIGRHPESPVNRVRTPVLVPVEDNPHLAPADKNLELGLAYGLAAQKVDDSESELFRERARRLLIPLREAGLRDPQLSWALRVLTQSSNPAQARSLALEVLQAKDASAQCRADALWHMVNCYRQEKRYEAAREALEELVGMRRLASDWRALGMAYLGLEEPEKAVTALKYALAIRPFRPGIHAALAEAYQRLGEEKLAQEHLDKARWLSEHQQD
jgi:predicted CXXCH cytochrome family protein